jgi:tetratricopeptide (TPR) repeat protein
LEVSVAAGSQKQEREDLCRAMRARGAVPAEIAAVLRQRFRVNARVALRQAHSWSQQRAAEEWNRRWPDSPKSHKSISYWELWPASSGHAPSLEVMQRLAAVYACSVADLLADLSDGRDDPAAEPGKVDASALATVTPPRSPAEILLLDLLNQPETTGSDADAQQSATAASAPIVQRIQEADFYELAQVIVMWAQRWNPRINRRDLLEKLSLVFAAASAAPILGGLANLGDSEVRAFADDPTAFSEPALVYCESMLVNLRRQGDVVGPRLTLQSAAGHRRLAEQLARTAPSAFRQRAISAFAELSQLIGWFFFNMGDYRGAQEYYEEARAAAHEAENVELVTYVLCTMSHLATWQGRPRVGIDHAVAAAVWAEQSNSPIARAYAADVAVRAYMADGQRSKCRENLDIEHATVRGSQDGSPQASWWYFYDESFYWSTHTQVALRFRETDAALESVEKALALFDPTNLHARAHRSLYRADALIQRDEIDEACVLVGEVVSMSAVNSSRRIDERVGSLRAKLEPWNRVKGVRQLDEVLATYRTLEIGKGK